MRVVEVTHHALEQFRVRFPLESGSSGYLRLLIADEVGDALDHGRYATKQPNWAYLPGKQRRGMRSKTEYNRSLRYVWTESQTRMYLVERSSTATRVITSISPKDVNA